MDARLRPKLPFPYVTLFKHVGKKTIAFGEPTFINYLCPLAHFQKRTDGVEGSCATDVQVGLVERLEDPDEVRTLLLEKIYNFIHLAKRF